MVINVRVLRTSLCGGVKVAGDFLGSSAQCSWIRTWGLGGWNSVLKARVTFR